VSQTWRLFGSPGQHFCDRLSAAADGAFAGPPLPRSACRQIHLQPPVRRSLFDFDHASQKLPKPIYGHQSMVMAPALKLNIGHVPFISEAVQY
jgi:hypothetical protein